MPLALAAGQVRRAPRRAGVPMMPEPKPDPKIAGRLALIVLLVMFAFTALMVWIAA